MNKADKYLKETITEILEEGQWDKEPRTRWADSTPAHSKFVTQKVYQYDISKGEFPINTLRTTALKGGFHDIEAIYIKQTNILEEMHPSIHSWWKDFVVDRTYRYAEGEVDEVVGCDEGYKQTAIDKGLTPILYESYLGATYGATVKRYNLVDKLLKGLEENPFSRRHKMSLWQEQQVIDDPKSLEPCAGLTLWSVREGKEFSCDRGFSEYTDEVFGRIVVEACPFLDASDVRHIDLTLIQRSQDYITTSSINSSQYVMLAMMVANHLTFKTGIKHEVGKLLHIVQNCHIYDRHLDAAKEILKRESTGLQPKIELICEPKLFRLHTIEDFKFSGLEGIEKLSNNLEIAI